MRRRRRPTGSSPTITTSRGTEARAATPVGSGGELGAQLAEAPAGTRQARACPRRPRAGRARTRGRPTTAPASRVKPFGVIHHGLRCIATNSAPRTELAERDVEVAERQVVARVADHDRRDGLGASIRLVRGEELLAGPLPPRVRCGEHEERLAGVLGRGVRGRRRGSGDDLGAIDLEPGRLPERRRKRRAVRRREVGHDPIRDAAPAQLDHRLGCALDRRALEHQDAVRVEDEGAHALERGAQVTRRFWRLASVAKRDSGFGARTRW